MPDVPHVFTKAAAQRIVRNSKYVDYKARNQVKDLPPPVSYDGLSVMVVTTALPSASGRTFGVGAGKYQAINSAGTAYVDVDATTFPIINIHANRIAVGAVVLCGPSNGFLHFVTTACSNVS